MANRLTRDQILLRALDRVDSPTLDQKEQPTPGTISGTLGAGYLQEALDYWYKCFPIKGVLKTSTITLASGSPVVNVVSQVSDFLTTYQDGIILASDQGRLVRRGLSTLLNEPVGTTGKPNKYAITDDVNITIRPVPDKNYPATLYYYALPSALAAGAIPPFPDDLVLVRYMVLAYKEWLGSIQEGTALEYARGLVAALQKAGHGSEPEPDQVELDRQYFGEQFNDGTDWMGKTIPS